MRRCQYVKCGLPLPDDARANQVYCRDKSCKQLAYKERKKLERSVKEGERSKNVNSETVNRKPETVNPTVPGRGRSVRQGEKGGIIKQHNAHFKFKILTDDYTLDPDMWVPYKDPRGRATGKYTNIKIRDACGFTYLPKKHRGKKPPLSVVKGKHTNKIEVHINQDSTEAEIWGLLEQVYEFLLINLDAPIEWPPETVKWKQGPEKGNPKRDFTIKSKFVEEVRAKEPELIGTQAPRRPTDKHDNAKIGDGSHTNKIEVLSEEQALIYAYLHGRYNHLPMEEAAKEISEEANDVIYTKEKVDVIEGKADLHALTDDNSAAAILRRIKEGSEVARLEMTALKIEVGLAVTSKEEIDKRMGALEQGTMGLHRAVEALVASELGTQDVLRELARGKYTHLYKRRGK